MNQHSIYCTEEQTRKALSLGAPIENHYFTFGNNETCTYLGKDYTQLPALDWFAQQPTTGQLIEWLEEQNKQSIEITNDTASTNWKYEIFSKNCSHYDSENGFNSCEEATIAAIDAALDCLSHSQKQV